MVTKTSQVSFASALVGLDQIRQEGENVRRNIDPAAVARLAGSMRVHGLLQPIGVTRSADGTYQLLWGYTRYLAAVALGWTSIRCIVLPFGEHRLLTLIENVVRESLTPKDEAISVNRLINEGICTQSELARSIGKGKSLISRLNRLGEAIGRYSDKVAFTQLSLTTYLELISTPQLFEQAEKEGWSPAAARKEARRHKRDANQESLPLQPGHVPAPGKGKRPRRGKALTDETLPTFEPVIQYDDGFTIQELSFSAKRPVDREAVIEKLTDLQVKIDHCIKRLRTEWTVTPEANPAIENHTREVGGPC